MKAIAHIIAKISKHLSNIYHFAHAKARQAHHAVTRPSAVTHAQHEHVKKFPECAACGATKGVQGHHIKPYHKFPDDAAKADNFISLCETVGGPQCHIRLGHGGCFRDYVENVVEVAAQYRAAQTSQERDEIVARAKAARLPDQPINK